MFQLPKLDYDYSALEPYIDTKTMEIHHSKHHAGYVKKLNEVLAPIHSGSSHLTRNSRDDSPALKSLAVEPKDKSLESHG